MVIIKYDWLIEYQELDEEIQLLKWKIQKSELELDRWLDPNDLGKYKLTNKSKSSNLEEDIKKQKAYLNEKELAMESLMIMVNRFRGLDKKIIKMKYIDGLTLDSIAYELGYTPGYIRNKHAAIVRTIKFVEELSID